MSCNVSISLVNTGDIIIRTRSTRTQSMIFPLELVKINEQELFFVSSFVRLLAYAWTTTLCLCLCRRLEFIPLFCLLFCSNVYAYVHV